MSRPLMLLTGATGGVGYALVERLRSADWDAVGVYRSDAERAAELEGRWADTANSLRLFRADLTDERQVESLIGALGEDFCPDALVHLAAPRLTAAALHRTGWDEIQRQIDGTLKPVVLLTQPLLSRMLRRGAGRVVATLSAVVLGTPPRGFSSYTTAKYAVAGYLKCLAAEYAARGIVTATVSPGSMATGLLADLPALLTDQMRAALPRGEWIDPAAVARAVFWLAAEAGPEVNGANLPLTGGMTA